MANTTGRKRLSVYIGRFQPFHNGHAHILEQAIETSDKVLVLVGSAFIARDIRNPFTFSERFDMINAWVIQNYLITDKWPIIKPLVDQHNTPKWLQLVQETVDATIKELGWKRGDVDVAITGADRDSTTWYLNSFPQYISDLKPAINVAEELSASKLRHRLFSTTFFAGAANWLDVPTTTVNFLRQFHDTKAFETLREEYEFNIKYKNPHFPLLAALKAVVSSRFFNQIEEVIEKWWAKQYDRTYVTSDACIIQSGHVLVVRRGALPGKGLIALPGGFVKSNQTLLLAAIAEAIEETGLKLAEGKNWRKITEAILRGSLVATQNFDDPNRSLRGRTFTTCHLFRLDDTKPLPIVKGQYFPIEDIGVDGIVETEDAFFMPISVALANPEWWFEDHHIMLSTMLGLIKD